MQSIENGSMSSSDSGEVEKGLHCQNPEVSLYCNSNAMLIGPPPFRKHLSELSITLEQWYSNFFSGNPICFGQNVWGPHFFPKNFA
jgi:hypothetical protein